MARVTKAIEGVYEKNPGSGVWYVRYRVGGNLVRKAVGTRQQASDYLKKVKYLRATGEGEVARSAKEVTRTKEEMADLQEKGITLADLCDQYLTHIQNPKNPHRPKDQVNPPIRVKAIRAKFGDRSAASVAPHEISDWLAELGKKPGTLNRYKGTFSSIYSYATERGLTSRNPVRDTKAIKAKLGNPVYLNEKQEAKLYDVLKRWIDECPDDHEFTKLELMCHPLEMDVALGTGLRKSNQYGLRWEWIDMRARTITIPKEHMKTDKDLVIPVIDRVADAFKQLKKIQQEMTAYQSNSGAAGIRMKSDGRVFNISEPRSWWEKALKEAKLKLRWHDLRHTTASRMAQAGVPIKTIMEALGHGSINTTSRYAHLTSKHVAEGMSVLNTRPSE